MRADLQAWQFWAFLSAVFAALTAIFAKVGVANIDSNFATLVRTAIILPTLAVLVLATSGIPPLASVSGRTYLFLALSALATGASWLCYFRALQIGDASRVAPLDKMSVVLVAVFGVVFLGERLDLRGWLGIALVTTGVVLIAWRR